MWIKCGSHILNVNQHTLAKKKENVTQTTMSICIIRPIRVNPSQQFVGVESVPVVFYTEVICVVQVSQDVFGDTQIRDLRSLDRFADFIEYGKSKSKSARVMFTRYPKLPTIPR